MTGWVKRRSTRTTTVLSCLSLTTTPWSVRFGISDYSGLAFERAARLGLVPGFARGAVVDAGAGRPERFSAAIVLIRAMSRRTCRTRAVFSSCPVARWKRRLNRSFLSLRASSSSWSTVMARRSPGFMTILLRDALDEARLDRQLGGGESKRLARHLHRHAVDLEQDAPWFDAGDPEFRRPLARTHAHLERLLRHRHVRIDANPNPARALHVAGKGAARGLDLARGDPLRLQRLEPELAERQVDARGRNPLDAAFVRLAEFGAHRLQHGCSPFLTSLPAQRSRRVATRTPDLAFRHLLVLRHRIVFHDLALEDPDLDAAGAIGGESRGHAIVDVRAQRMQRHAALAIPFHARDLGAAEAPRAVDADAAGAEPHRRLHGALHGAAEGHAALELLRDRFGDELSIELRLADLDDVDHDVGFRELGDLLAKLLDVGALLADDDARPRRLNGDAALLVRPLDHDLRHRRLLEVLHQLLADLDVLVQQLPVLVLAGVPARIPGAVDAEAQADWIDLLTHWLPLKKPRPRPRARRWSGSRTALESGPCGRGRAGESA